MGGKEGSFKGCFRNRDIAQIKNGNFFQEIFGELARRM